MAENYALSAFERIRARIVNGKFQKGLDVNTMEIGNARPWASLHGNTRVQIRVLDSTGQRNNLEHDYYRIPLSAVIAHDTVVTSVGAVMSHDLLPAILTDYGINLTPQDIVNEALTDSPYLLKATPDSLGFIGSVQIQLGDTGDLGFTLLRTADERLIKVGNRYLRKS